MLNAKQAKEQMETMKITNLRAEIEKTIKRAIQKGRDVFYLLAPIPIEVEKELTEAGYSIEKQTGRTKISW